MNIYISYFFSFLLAYMASMIPLFGIFLATMLLHYQRIDFEYLVYALYHILIISIVPGVFGIVLHRNKFIIKALIGLIVGVLIAALFVNQ